VFGFAGLFVRSKLYHCSDAPLSGSNSIIVLMRAVTVGHIANVLYNARDLGIDGSIILNGS
jgi:hypothetical protein